MANYPQSGPQTGEAVKQKVKAGVSAVKKRAVALKLAREVNHLTSAIDGEYEKLGTLMLAHRPEKPDISADIAALSQIQNEISQKEATYETLRQTEGRGPVAKELAKELTALRENQKRQMIAIGQKAAEAQADMPGAAAHYQALGLLKASLEPKQAQLKALQDELGPILQDTNLSAGSLRGPAIALACVIVGLLVLYFGWTAASGLFASRLPDWVAQACPEDVTEISFRDMRQLRGTELDDSQEDKKNGNAPLFGVPGLELKLDDVTSFATFTHGGGGCVAFESEEDLPLEDLFEEAPKDSEIKEKHDQKYVERNGNLIAKISKKHYMIYPKCQEGEFRSTLKRIDRKEDLKFDKYLQQALEKIVGADSVYIASTNREMPFDSVSGLKAMGMAISVGSQVSVENVLVFRKSSDAKDFCKEYPEWLEELEDEADDALKDAAEAEKSYRRRDEAEGLRARSKGIEMFLEWAEEASISRSGSVVRLSSKRDIEDFKNLTQF